MNENLLTIEDLGLQNSCLRDAASNGLGYLFRTVKTKAQLMPLIFCKDYFQDFTYVNKIKDETKGTIYGYKATIVENVFEENDRFNLLLIPHSKHIKIQDYFSNPKVTLALNSILNESNMELYKKQLNIFENQLMKLNFINRFTEVEIIDVKYHTKDIPLIQNKAVSLLMDKKYFEIPELLSLYLLFVRLFLTCYIFIDEYKDIYNYLDKVDKFKTSYIYEGDSMALNNPSIRLNLPMFLEGKFTPTNWELLKNQTINQIHNYTGIVSYLNKPKLISQ